MPPFDMPDASHTFDERGGWLINRLVAELAPLTPVQAAGIAGNLGGESGLLPDINEKHPLVEGSRGGFGWEQATGSRRTALEAWATMKGLDVGSDEANYGFLVNELLTTEAHALDRLRQTTTVEAAVYTFEVLFERPSDPQGGLASRVHYAQRALAAATQLPVPPGPTLPSPDPDNSADALNGEELRQIQGENAAPVAGEAAPQPPSKIELLRDLQAQTDAAPSMPLNALKLALQPPARPPPDASPPIGIPPAPPDRDGILARAPWWMLPALGALVLAIFAGALLASCFMDNDTLRTQMFAIAGAGFTTALGFFFGSSSGSAQKDQVLAERLRAATSTPTSSGAAV